LVFIFEGMAVVPSNRKVLLLLAVLSTYHNITERSRVNTIEKNK